MFEGQSLKGLSSRRATWPLALGVRRWQPMMFSVTSDVMDFTRFSTPRSVTCRSECQRVSRPVSSITQAAYICP